MYRERRGRKGSQKRARPQAQGPLSQRLVALHVYLDTVEIGGEDTLVNRIVLPTEQDSTPWTSALTLRRPIG